MKATFQAAEPVPLETSRVRKARQYPRPGRIWMVSLVLALSWIGLMTFVVSGCLLLGQGAAHYGWLALSGLGLFVGMRVVGFLFAQRLHCTLCHGTVLQEKRCHKHAEAQRIPPLSYRSSAVLSVLFTGTFRCMYCGTPYRLRK